MLSIGKCRDLDYYEREVIAGREDYLSEAGTAPGLWAGSLATRDGLCGVASRDDLIRAFAGEHPDGTPLTAHRVTVNGFDLTLSPSKSVSLVWALGSPDDAAAVERALYTARAEVERYLETHACRVRRGHAGARVEPGAGFLGAVFLHRTSRLGDPGVHLHWTIFNVTEGADGRRTALDARAIYRERYTAESIFQATLRRELSLNLGIVFDEVDRHGVAEIVGISHEMRTAFSRRRTEIVAEMERRGVHSGDGARTAALATRRAKPQHITEAELRAEWRARALDHRFSLAAVPRVTRRPVLSVSDEDLALAVTAEHATYTRSDLIRTTARCAHQGATLDEILDRADEFIALSLAIPIAEGVWTTEEMLRLEQRIVAFAQKPARPDLAASRGAVEQALAARPSMSDEQRHMVERVCGDGAPLSVVIGRAGAGKTFTLDSVRDACEQSGRRVVGASLAARAAAELTAGSGIRATTAHALAAALDQRRTTLRPGDVLVIDEAGMLGTRMLAQLVAAAEAADAKVVLVGDHKQLPAIEAGGILEALRSRGQPVELTENRRLTNEHERAATTALRHGHVATALATLNNHDRVRVGPNSDAIRDQMIDDWHAHHTAGDEVVMTAVHRSDVRDLNRRAHDRLRATGAVGPSVAIVDDRSFHLGDTVLASKNRYDLGILNGQRGIVIGATPRGIELHLDDDRHVHLPLDYVSEHVEHSYARTVHKTQGLTCDVALLLGDDTLYAELGYTGITRGRLANYLYTVAAADDDLGHLARSLSTSRAKTAAIDYLDGVER